MISRLEDSGFAVFGIFLDPEDASDMADFVRGQGRPFSLIKAVDGRAGLKSSAVGGVIPHIDEILRGEPSSGPEIACAESHRLAYEAFISESKDWALVLEEDVILVGDLSQIDELIRNVPNHRPTIISLWCRGVCFAENRTMRPIGQSLQMFNFRYVPPQTAAYLINRSAAQLALASGSPRIADWPSWASRVQFIGVFPWVFAESGRESTISDANASPIWESSLSTNMRKCVQLLRVVSQSNRYGLSSSEVLYRRYLPLVEAKLWRMRKMRRLFDAQQGPAVPSPWLKPLAVIVRKRSMVNKRDGFRET